MKYIKNIAAVEQYAIDTATKLRVDHHLTQREIGKVLGTKTSFIGNVENYKNSAKYNLKHINLLAAFFKVSPQFFIPNIPFL